MKATGSVVGGALLIAGTCVGAGMLGLPVMTAAAGFYPTIAAFLLVWLFMTCSALAYLEVSLRFPGEVNLISMAGKTLGRGGKTFAWITYVLFLYSLMAAYTAGGTTMLANILDLDIQGDFESRVMPLLFAAPFAGLVYLGTGCVDLVNRLLMIGLIVAFIGMCYLALHTSPTHIFKPMGDSKYLLAAFPLLVTAFGYHLLIPTLKTYLNEDIKKLRYTIIVGSLLPLVVYAVWELIVLNLIPTWGAGGLVEMLNSGINPADTMAQSLEAHGPTVTLFVVWFAFFALTTSFIGVGLGIFDFFADGMHFKHTKGDRVILSIITFVPPVFYTLIYPQGFLLALNYAGVFAAILLVIYPVAMAWHARYVKNIPGSYQMFGGKLVLVLTLIFGLLVVMADIYQQQGLLPIPHN